MQLVKDRWYPILLSQEVKKNRPLGTERLGQKWVLWRDSQANLHGHQDRCPHLGAALSLGEVCGDHLVCPFHGFEFDAQGQCRLIPANGKAGKIPAGMVTAQYIVQEAHGFIWLWWGEQHTEYPPLLLRVGRPTIPERLTTNWMLPIWLLSTGPRLAPGEGVKFGFLIAKIWACQPVNKQNWQNWRRRQNPAYICAYPLLFAGLCSHKEPTHGEVDAQVNEFEQPLYSQTRSAGGIEPTAPQQP
ncbi:MAG: Rieske (2Fe-2S) protein [Candidatus Sericytochromatia bacterium]|nr:Rieske (2Fe-2S) protein [Candidatus Sericytochromatia bacterium]